jgi:DoxX-like protein
METANPQRARLIAYWITTLLGPASFVIGGVLFLSRAERPASQLADLGYPAYLLYVLGVWKVLGAIAVVVPGLPLLKEWAYAGFFFELSGGVARARGRRPESDRSAARLPRSGRRVVVASARGQAHRAVGRKRRWETRRRLVEAAAGAIGCGSRCRRRRC